ncbi:MAG TPA: type II secretion system protein N [Marinobacter sp.]|nr:type II secretion system protein N [Marinobacter sp.]
MLAIDRRIPPLLALAVAVAMVGLTAWQGYRFWQSETSQSAPRVQPAVDAGSTGPQVPSVELADLTLFGAHTPEGSPEASHTENLPETNLRLFLRGVLAADGDFPGSALIEDDQNNTEAYLVGDELPGSARLRTVFPNRIILERGGKLENLYFPVNEDRSRFEIAASTDPEPEMPEAEPVREITPAPAASATRAPASDQQRREEIRQRLEQLRQRLQNTN